MNQSWIQWIPAVSLFQLAGLLLVAITIAIALQFIMGRSLVRNQWLILGLRLGSVGLAIVILLGPTWIERSAPLMQRPTMLFLFDGSSSKKLGMKSTRWQDALDFVNQGFNKTLPGGDSDCQSYRFGHRLAPLNPTLSKTSSAEKLQIDNPMVGMTKTRLSPANRTSLLDRESIFAASSEIPDPDASDTRLADALRELTTRIDFRDTAGVVLLSDGRVRGSESVEQLATLFGKRNVPIHVVPVGQSEGTGDIAIVSVITQPSVRKFTENEIQVFIRSFGMAGEQTTVRVVDKHLASDSKNANITTSVTSIPVTLSGGAQSVTLVYNIADKPCDFEIIVDPIKDELTDSNNKIDVHVGIDRTRVRVLFIEGSTESRGLLSQLLPGVLGGPQQVPSSNGFSAEDALREDIDIECVGYYSTAAQSPPRPVDLSVANTKEFPSSRSELFSYDCIVLSNVGPDVLSVEQQEMIVQWIEGRGAGLIISGDDATEMSKWKNSPLAKVLPVSIESPARSKRGVSKIKVEKRSHAIWKLQGESALNDQLLETIPSLRFANLAMKVKPGADVLAVDDQTGDPIIVSHRFGRGRVLLSAPALAGNRGQSLPRDWGNQGKLFTSKLWRNMVYWSTEGATIGRRRIIVEADKRFYRPGEKIILKASAYDEAARRTTDYRLWGMFEPLSIDDSSFLTPILWPENVRRESGETSPRIAWGEELSIPKDVSGSVYGIEMNLSDTTNNDHRGLRLELTAYSGDESNADSSFGHGTQVDSVSMDIYVLSDPFEQQNPLPNHDLLQRVAKLSGGKVLRKPEELTSLLQSRAVTQTDITKSEEPAWSKWWLWCVFAVLITSEWVVRRLRGFA